MRVLYIDGVGSFGGASRSLAESVRAMPSGRVEPYFVVADGSVVGVYGEVARGLIAARGLTRFDDTRYSHYRGVRWLVALRELGYLGSSLSALLRARREWGTVDVIHANEVTDILPALIARRLFGAPTVVHVRSLARVDPRSRRTRWLAARLRQVEAVIAIDENVRSTLPLDLPVEVIHNSFGATADLPEDPQLASRLAATRPGSLKVGFVGNLHHSKGLFVLIEAVRDARAAGRDVECLLVGGTTRAERGLKAWVLGTLGLAQSVRAELVERIARYGLEDSVHLLGPTRNIRQVYDHIDVLAFPSHFDAPGRPVF